MVKSIIGFSAPGRFTATSASSPDTAAADAREKSAIFSALTENFTAVYRTIIENPRFNNSA